MIVQVIRSFLQDLEVENQTFQNKGYRPKKKDLINFFSYFPLWQTSSKIRLGSTRYFRNYGASYKIISSTPKKVTQNENF